MTLKSPKTRPKFFQDFQSSNQHGTVVFKKRAFYGHGFRSGGSFVLNRSTELIAESTLALMLRRVRKKEWMSSDGLHLKHEIHEFLMFPKQCVHTEGFLR